MRKSKSVRIRLLFCVALGAMVSNTVAPMATASAAESPTATPIKHVIIIIGENRTFDHILNNYNPGYFGDGSNAYTDTNQNNFVCTIPPSSVRNIGDALNEKNISWASIARPARERCRRS
jgi:hypothetical protein